MSRPGAIVLTLFAASVGAHEGLHPHHHPHPPMSPLMRAAVANVEYTCHTDVFLMCSAQPTLADLLPHPMLRLGTPPRDPLMEYMMNPMAPPPPMMANDLGPMIDLMMSHAIQLTQEVEVQPVQHFVRVYFISDDEEEEPQQISPVPPPVAPEDIFDSMVHSVMDRAAITSSEHPAVVLEQLVEHGNNMLESDLADESRLSLARRLTQVSPENFHHHGPRLPLSFGCERNRCLMSAYEEGATSNACSDAIKAAEKTHDIAVARHALIVEKENEAFLTFTLLYAVLAIVTLIVLRKHLRKIGRRMHSNLKLKRSVLQAVYNDPAIKAKVEDSIGMEIGNVPPLPPHVLARMGGPNPFPPGFFFFKMCKLAFFAFILSLIFINPVLAMPLLCVAMLQRFIHLTCCPPQPPVAMCSCCCCGLSTEDVSNGMISKVQACCTCCNGMGVCAPGCTSCCGSDPDVACDCCEDDCDCCNPKPAPECNCCCCSVSPDDVLRGDVTEAQACCTCCDGTGECGSGCKACCGDDPDGACDCCEDGCDCCCGDDDDYSIDPDMPALVSRVRPQGLYEGVPIQIV